MEATPLAIPDVILLEPKIFGDYHGFFFESFNQRKFVEFGGRNVDFVQENHSCSVKNVLRGLHYQIKHKQRKLVRVAQDAFLDVAVGIRKSSSTFGQHIASELSAENKRMLCISYGFAYGFGVLSDTAEFLYKTTDYWFSELERSIRGDDPDLAIDWMLQASPALSGKDAQGKTLAEVECFA